MAGLDSSPISTEELHQLKTRVDYSQFSTDQSNFGNAVLRSEVRQNKVFTGNVFSKQEITPLSRVVCKVASKIPSFWHQFRIPGITSDQTKFEHVVAQLNFKIRKEIEGMVIQTDKYDFLKKELIRRLSQSEQQRIHELLTKEQLDERKPSQFLRLAI